MWCGFDMWVCDVVIVMCCLLYGFEVCDILLVYDGYVVCDVCGELVVFDVLYVVLCVVVDV